MKIGDSSLLAATLKCLAICSISSKVNGDLPQSRRLIVDRGMLVAVERTSMLSRRAPSNARTFAMASSLRLE